MSSSGALLIITDKLSKLAACKAVMIGISSTSVFLFFVVIFTHKMIGLEILNTFQVIYLAHLANK